jgi:hypothetical protein
MGRCAANGELSFSIDMLKKLKLYGRYLQAFFGKSWNIEEYPLVIETQDEDPRFPKCYASIDGWDVLAGFALGSGDTAEIAKQRLSKALEDYKAIHGFIHPPGSIRTDKEDTFRAIKRYDYLVNDFIRNVLPDVTRPLFISDSTDLDNFISIHQIQDLDKRIFNTYNIDTSKLPSRNFVRLLMTIKAQKLVNN